MAGVCALILQTNPNLTWRDVRRILAHTATMNDAADGDWVANAATPARMVNHKYGYGQVNAQAAVAAAAGFTSIGTGAAPIVSAVDTVNMMIPDMDATGITRMINHAGAGNVDLATARITLNTANLRNLEVNLTSPSGTVSRLLVADPAENAGTVSGMVVINGTIDLTTTRLMGELATGNWMLQVRRTTSRRGRVGPLRSA